jgi:hypothetical protein
MLAADEPKQKVEATDTQRTDFPPGGMLWVMKSIGVVTVEGWDRPEVEITTIKSTKAAYDAQNREAAARELGAVRVATERRGNEVIITTDYPRHWTIPLPYALAGGSGVNLEYRIKAPYGARLVVDHGAGEVNVDGLSGDIDVTLLRGEVTLHLPEQGQYAVRARSDIGNVNSDFPGAEKRRRWPIGHRIAGGEPAAPHKLNLKVGLGDIVILKTRTPEPPGPLAKVEGL